MVVPSSLTAAEQITKSPNLILGWTAPADPILMRYLAPQDINSSIAIAADGPPMPVEATVIGTPL